MSGTPLIVLSMYVSSSLVFYFQFYLLILYFFKDQNTRRESGRKVQLGNVEAAKVSENEKMFPESCHS